MNNTEGRDEIRHFFKECHQITSEAQFLVDSLPHAEIEVERAIRQLNAVRVILVALNDPHSTAEQIEHLAHYVDSLIRPLERFLDQPPPPARAHIPRHHTNKSGRPAYSLDLNCALLLTTSETLGMMSQKQWASLDPQSTSSPIIDILQKRRSDRKTTDEYL
ncbi:hypothetical protein C8J57DRAFT_1728439 [Mycena rebaudengoi]|nr:hypothetical protein C8J57DRAFT_1728439 [Mycena rebaudengoi]